MVTRILQIQPIWISLFSWKWSFWFPVIIFVIFRQNDNLGFKMTVLKFLGIKPSLNKNLPKTAMDFPQPDTYHPNNGS